MRVIKCARCGEDVFTTGPRTKYCLACATQIRIENQNKRRSGKGKPDPAHTKHITCEICGKDVIVPAKAARAKYCPECSAKAYKAATKKHRDKERNTIICVRCGAEVVLKSPQASRRMYCDDCQKIVYAELNRKAKAAAKERKRTDGLQGNQKRCARCGVIFEKRGFRKYCDDCRPVVKREQTVESNRRRKNPSFGETVESTCKICGKSFSYDYRGGKQREFCNMCSPNRRDENAGTIEPNYHTGWHKSEKPRKKKKPHVSQIVDLNEAARKAGMSYGRYVAMLAMQRQRKEARP